MKTTLIALVLFVFSCLAAVAAGQDAAPMARPTVDDNETTWNAWIVADVLKQPASNAGRRLLSGSYVDIYDDANAVAWEVEWLNKTDEAFGQAARYATNTGFDAGIWILRRPGMKGWQRFKDALSFYERAGVRFYVRVTDVRDGSTTTIRGD